jgi:hypothetical protein
MRLCILGLDPSQGGNLIVSMLLPPQINFGMRS